MKWIIYYCLILITGIINIFRDIFMYKKLEWPMNFLVWREQRRIVKEINARTLYRLRLNDRSFNLVDRAKELFKNGKDF